MDKYINVPLTAETAASLRAGDYVYLSGTIYTARDAAHKRMYEALERGEKLPLDMKNNVIYYMGPSPARTGRPIGSAGPLLYCRIFSSIRLPVIAAMMRKPRNTGTRLSSPSRQSNANRNTSSPIGVAIAAYLSGSWWAR